MKKPSYIIEFNGNSNFPVCALPCSSGFTYTLNSDERTFLDNMRSEYSERVKSSTLNDFDAIKKLAENFEWIHNKIQELLFYKSNNNLQRLGNRPLSSYEKFIFSINNFNNGEEEYLGDLDKLFPLNLESTDTTVDNVESILYRSSYDNLYKLDLLADVIMIISSINAHSFTNINELLSSSTYKRSYFDKLAKNIKDEKIIFPYNFKIGISDKGNHPTLSIIDLASNFQRNFLSDYSDSPWVTKYLLDSALIRYKAFSCEKQLSYIDYSPFSRKVPWNGDSSKDLENYYFFQKATGFDCTAKIFRYYERVGNGNQLRFFINKATHLLSQIPNTFMRDYIFEIIIQSYENSTHSISLAYIEKIFYTLEWFNIFNPYESMKKIFWMFVKEEIINNVNPDIDTYNALSRTFLTEFNKTKSIIGYKFIPEINILDSENLTDYYISHVTKKHKIFALIQKEMIREQYINISKYAKADDNSQYYNKSSLPSEADPYYHNAHLLTLLPLNEYLHKHTSYAPSTICLANLDKK